MIYFTGKNTDFTVTWNCEDQFYIAYKNKKILGKFYKFSEVKTYLN